MQYKKPDGKCAALNEMLHVMLRYSEVYTALRFVSICTMPLKLRVENNISLDAETNNYGFFITVFRIKFVITKRTYQIGINIPLPKGSSLIIYSSQNFLLIKLLTFTLDLLNCDQLLA